MLRSETIAKVLDKANKKRNTLPVSRWAMSPVHSFRRRASVSGGAAFHNLLYPSSQLP